MLNTTYIKYLDPKNDLTFRKIFGQHPEIMKSFLNSLLPLHEEQFITHLVYEDPAMLPELPELKHSIVDVKCTDNFGRQFIVEMQMYWTSSFKNRMLFNAGKAYVKQIDKGHKYSELCPVYGLSLVNDIFLTDPKYATNFYHHYRLAHHEIPQEEIKGIELIFIELPKFAVQNFTQKKMRNLWLRFLTEIDESTKEVSDDLTSIEAIKSALEYLQVSAFTKNELEYYEKYWDRVRVERAAIEEAVSKMKEAEIKTKEAESKAQEAEEREKIERNQKEEALNKLQAAVRKMNERGFSLHEIAENLGLLLEEIQIFIDKKIE